MIKSAHLTGPVSRKAGGLFDAVLRLVELQQEQGMVVKVFGLWDEFAEADLAAWKPVPVAAFKLSWPKLIGRSPRLIEELHSFAPDISHTHGLWLYPSIATKNYSRTNKRPYLISPHGMLDSWALKNSAWKKKLALRFYEREHLQNAACLRALCKSEAGAIRGLGLKNPICIIPNGIDLPERGKQAAGSKSPPWQGVVEPGTKVLLFLSRIHPKKGLVNLLRAWAKKQESEEWVLAIAGWDQCGHEQELKRLATELGVAWTDVRESSAKNETEAGKQKMQNRNEFQLSTSKNINGQKSVVFLGPQFGEAKAACYRYCDAFILPSFSEGLPMVVLEAWANSKPVMMTPECNLPEGFSAGAALNMEATEVGLVAGLNEMRRMTDAERLEMGSRGRDLVVERFTWTQVANQIETVHQWVLGGGPKPDCIVND